MRTPHLLLIALIALPLTSGAQIRAPFVPDADRAMTCQDWAESTLPLADVTQRRNMTQWVLGYVNAFHRQSGHLDDQQIIEQLNQWCTTSYTGSAHGHSRAALPLAQNIRTFIDHLNGFHFEQETPVVGARGVGRLPCSRYVDIALSGSAADRALITEIRYWIYGAHTAAAQINGRRTTSATVMGLSGLHQNVFAHCKNHYDEGSYVIARAAYDSQLDVGLQPRPRSILGRRLRLQRSSSEQR